MNVNCTWICVLLALVLQTPAWTQQVAYSVQSNGDDHLYSIDLVTGATTDMGLVGLNDAEGLAAVNNQLYAIGGSVHEFWDITTPPGTLIGPTGPRSGTDAGLDYDTTTGTMYNLNGASGGSYLYTVDLGTGAATLVGQSTSFGDGLAINSAGQAFSTDFIFSDGLYSVDLTTGTMTFIGGFNVGAVSLQAGASFDAQGTLWALTSNGGLYTIDTVTGAATLVLTLSSTGWEGFHITGGGSSTEYQVNQAGSSLDVQSIFGSSSAPAVVPLTAGQSAILHLSSTAFGFPWDLGAMIPPPVPASQGALVLPDGQIFNLDLADPTFGFLFNAFQSPGFVTVAIPFSIPVPTTASIQMANVDPGAPFGLSLSQPTHIIVQ